MYFKDFDHWNHFKKQINQTDSQIHIRAGEIRWVNLGVNVGSEIDGKGELFSRSVLILHVIGIQLALVIPLTSKIKSIPGYLEFTWKSSINSLCLHQIKVISQKRILSRKGRISEEKLKAIKTEIVKFYAL